MSRTDHDVDNDHDNGYETGGNSAHELVVRPRKVRKIAIPAAVLLVVVFAVVGALLRETPTGVYFRVSDQVAMVLLGVLLASGALLLIRPRVRAGTDGVEVRNIFTTRHYAWPLVLSVNFPDGAPWARLELPEDEYVPVMAIQATDGAHAVRAIRALRDLHRREYPDSGQIDGE